MNSPSFVPSSRASLRSLLGVAALVALSATPLAAQDAVKAPSGKWVANFVGRTGAEITVENAKKDTESTARFSVSNAGVNQQVAWDIAPGVCGDNAQSIVPRAKFRMIQTANDGSGSVRSTIPRLEPGKRYYARIFSPGTQADDRSVQCVNMSEQP